MTFKQSTHDEARALFEVSLSLDLVYEEYGMLYTVTVAHDYHETGRATAQAVGLSEVQTRHYLRLAGRTLPMGRPFDVLCKNGHDMSIHRKNSNGVTYCGECKRIRQKETDRLRYLRKKKEKQDNADLKTNHPLDRTGGDGGGEGSGLQQQQRAAAPVQADGEAGQEAGQEGQEG